jgi:hypothetical protein
MWSQVEKDLEKMLAAKIYRVLLTQDAVYRSFLMSAGLGPNFPSDDQIPPRLRENFAKAAKIRAHIIVAELTGMNALEEGTCGAKLVAGVAVFYRFWSSKEPARRVAPWWFEQSVMTVCRQQAGNSAEDRRQWLREHLAISLDWSRMDRIDVMSLGRADEVPAVVGKGLPQRVWSPSALSKGRTTSKEYWPNYDKYFPGGVRQTVFPFIPRVSGEDLNQFLGRG